MASRKRLSRGAKLLNPLVFLLGLALFSNHPNLQTAFQSSADDLVWLSRVLEKQEMDGSGGSKEQENAIQQEANQDADTSFHTDNEDPSLWQCPHLPTLHFSGDEPEEQEMLRNRYDQRYDQHGVKVDNLPPPVLETIPQGRLLVYPGSKGSTASAWNEEEQIITPDRGFLTYVAPPTNEILSTLPVMKLTGDYFTFPQRFQHNFGHFLHDHLPGLAWAKHILPSHTSFLLIEDSNAHRLLTFIDPDFVKRVTWIQKGSVVQVTGNLYTYSGWQRFGKDMFGAQRLWITSQKPMAPLPPTQNKKVIFYTRKSNDTRHGRVMDTKHEQDILDLIRRKMVEYGRDNEELVMFNGQENGETMSLEHQFQLFKSASTVIGPHGSGFANIVWLPESQLCDDRPKVLEFLARAPGEGQFHIQNGGPSKTYYYLFSTAPWVEYHHIFYSNHSTRDNMFISLGNVAEALDTMWGGNQLAPSNTHGIGIEPFSRLHDDATTTHTKDQSSPANSHDVHLQSARLDFIPQSSSMTLLHVGKAGGGFVRERLSQWGFSMKEMNICHPNPCPYGNAKSTVIAVRDPADRFASAFYWAGPRVCAPNDNRTGVLQGKLGSVKNHCRINPEVHFILFEKYKSDVNKLALGLCNPNEKGSAEEDVSKIEHARHSLQDWVRKDDSTSPLQAMVNEKGFQFAHQIDAGAAFLLANMGVNASTIEQHALIMQERDAEIARKLDRRINSSTHHKDLVPLSEAARLCLAMYYEQDYDIIGDMKQTACHGPHTDSCQAALQSILDRREALISKAK